MTKTIQETYLVSCLVDRFEHDSVSSFSYLFEDLESFVTLFCLDDICIFILCVTWGGAIILQILHLFAVRMILSNFQILRIKIIKF